MIKQFVQKYAYVLSFFTAVLHLLVTIGLLWQTDTSLSIDVDHAKRRSELLDSLEQQIKKNEAVINTLSNPVDRLHPDSTLKITGLTKSSFLLPVVTSKGDTIDMQVDMSGQWNVSETFSNLKSYLPTRAQRSYLLKGGGICETYNEVAHSLYAGILDQVDPGYYVGQWLMRKNELKIIIPVSGFNFDLGGTYKLYAVNKNLLYSEKKIGKRVQYTVFERSLNGTPEHLSVSATVQIHNKLDIIKTDALLRKTLLGKWTICNETDSVPTFKCRQMDDYIEFFNNGTCRMKFLYSPGLPWITRKWAVDSGELKILSIKTPDPEYNGFFRKLKRLNNDTLYSQGETLPVMGARSYPVTQYTYLMRIRTTPTNWTIGF